MIVSTCRLPPLNRSVRCFFHKVCDTKSLVPKAAKAALSQDLLLISSYVLELFASHFSSHQIDLPFSIHLRQSFTMATRLLFLMLVIVIFMASAAAKSSNASNFTTPEILGTASASNATTLEIAIKSTSIGTQDRFPVAEEISCYYNHSACSPFGAVCNLGATYELGKCSCQVGRLWDSAKSRCVQFSCNLCDNACNSKWWNSACGWIDVIENGTSRKESLCYCKFGWNDEQGLSCKSEFPLGITCIAILGFMLICLCGLSYCGDDKKEAPKVTKSSQKV